MRWDRGAGERENRGQEEYRTREREGREVGDLAKRAESGREMQNVNFLNSTMQIKSRTQNIFDLHLTSSQSLLRLLSKRAKENLRLG